jgi:hypothetical protein
VLKETDEGKRCAALLKLLDKKSSPSIPAMGEVPLAAGPAPTDSHCPEKSHFSD